MEQEKKNINSTHTLVMVFFRSILKNHPELNAKQRNDIYDNLMKLANISYKSGMLNAKKNEKKPQ